MSGAWPSGSERIGVVTGLAAEARIARRLGWRVAIGGGDAAGAYKAACDLADAGAAALISLGLAGGLDPALQAGALLVPSAVRTENGIRQTDAILAERLGGAMRRTLLGATAIVSKAAEKRRLWGETGCAAVDLESGPVAEAAAARGLPFAVLRAICDPAAMSLPPAASVALAGSGVISAGRVLASLLAEPGQLTELLRLGRYAVRARRSLLRRIAEIQPARPRRPAT